MSNEKIVAVIPAYNEEDFIGFTIDGLLNIDLIEEIIVVDDGSIDRTADIVRNKNVTLIRYDKNRGKGYAIKRALESLDYKYLLLIDADLGCSCKEVIKLINPILSNTADVTIAKFKPAVKKGGFGLVKRLSKYGVWMYTSKKLEAPLSGQRVYTKEVMEKISYIPNNFGIEVAMTIGALKSGFRIKEIEVEMAHRETGRQLKDFLHRGKQFLDIFKTLLIMRNGS